MSRPNSSQDLDLLVEEMAARFAVLSAPKRLRIISSLCHGEKNVGQLLAEIDTTQPNLSQHLATLHRAGFVRKRRQANQIYYTIANERIVRICQLMCGQD